MYQQHQGHQGPKGEKQAHHLPHGAWYLQADYIIWSPLGHKQKISIIVEPTYNNGFRKDQKVSIWTIFCPKEYDKTYFITWKLCEWLQWPKEPPPNPKIILTQIS